MAELEQMGQDHQSDEDQDRAEVSPDPHVPREPSTEEPPKKRRRTAKPNADKKFECKHEGCGKSYSRAEHLYRHQLNHTPKTIYRCDFPDCHRYFVRQDLCVRHRERHITAGSQLHKRDAFAQASSNQNKKPASISPAGAHENAYDISKSDYPPVIEDDGGEQLSDHYMPTDPALDRGVDSKNDQRLPAISASTSNHAIDPRFLPPTPRTNTVKSHMLNQRSHSYGTSPISPDQANQTPIWLQRPDSSSSTPNRYAAQILSQSVPQSPVRTYSNSSNATNPAPAFRNTSGADTYNTSLHRDNNFFSNSDLLGMHYSSTMRSPGLSRNSQDAFTAAVTQGLNANNTDPYLYANVHGGSFTMDMGAGYGYPVFGAEDYSRSSPFTLNDDFANWLFNDNTIGQPNFSPDFIPGTSYSDDIKTAWPSTSQDVNSNPTYQDSFAMAHHGNIPHILNSSQPANYIMSEEKRQELLDLMQTQFVERAHDAVKKRKDMVFEGDVNANDHVLSLRMMHTYIGSYWYHQHAQLPILHKSTFSADKTPTLLLLAVVAIGAATLDKAYGTALTDSAAEFANFVVWHLRWEIVRDIDFRPPAKLWVFQTLLLIEVYEKMYSTKTLHERAHIHHDSTLTLMRRGSSLISRNASESPPSLVDDRNSRSSINGINGLHDANHSSDEAWHRWIATEATRRAAFGAFVLDAIHCTMFGHSAKMVAHEMRIALPCDEALWSATSPAEVGRVQASLRTNGVKPIGFLEGLKKTLNGQQVRTNSFGRTIIMAGLLSVSWHMAQRDLQIASIGPRAANNIGGPDKWKGTLLRAFDNWKRDFDEALAEAAAAPLSPSRLIGAQNPKSLLRPVDDENIFESRTVLHHLAHIAAHVDIVDCQVFAGASRLLSRSVTPKDYSVIRDKIGKWATRASARDSAFYALKFITTVLIPPNAGDNSIDSRIYGHASPILPQAYESDRYIARDDFLLNRPWVLYISALVVWCYGYALEGPIDPPPRDEDFATYEQREKDMRAFLDRVAGVRAPDDLEHVAGKNRCLGLLMILQESFGSTRWELTHEAAGLLGNAAMKLKGQGLGEDTMGRSRKDASTTSAATKGKKVNGGSGGNSGSLRPDYAVDQRSSSASTFNTLRP